MKDRIKALAAGFMGLALIAPARGQEAPPVPAPSIPPPPAAAPDAAPAPPAAAPDVSGQATAPAPEAAITLQGEKAESIRSGKLHDGIDEGAKTDVKAEGNVLTMAITGVAGAHTFVGLCSASAHEITLTQEFDITSTDPRVGQVSVAVEGTLQGYLRSRHKGSACLKLASATIAPASGGYTPFSLAFSPSCVAGCDGKALVSQSTKLPDQVLPVGRYVLTANFTIEAGAEGLLNGHGVANFSPDDLPTGWAQENDPFKDEDVKAFGFGLTVTATVPPGVPGNAQASRAKTVSPGVKTVGYAAPAARRAAR